MAPILLPAREGIHNRGGIACDFAGQRNSNVCTFQQCETARMQPEGGRRRNGRKRSGPGESVVQQSAPGLHFLDALVMAAHSVRGLCVSPTEAARTPVLARSGYRSIAVEE